MSQRDDVHFTDLDLAQLLSAIGVGCVTYRYAPFYGATPLALAALVLIWLAVRTWRRRK